MRELLAPLPVPVHPIPGNHDDRDALREAFADHPGVASSRGDLRYAADCGRARVLMCDTLLPGTPAAASTRSAARGSPPRRRRAPTLVAMHHPADRTGIAEFDAIGLPAGDVAALAGSCAARDVLRVVAGHIHRAITAGRRRPVCVAPSAWRQALLDLGPDGRPSLDDDRAPGYALHLLTPARHS